MTFGMKIFNTFLCNTTKITLISIIKLGFQKRKVAQSTWIVLVLPVPVAPAIKPWRFKVF
jgi:hypothetical protein